MAIATAITPLDMDNWEFISGTWPSISSTLAIEDRAGTHRSQFWHGTDFFRSTIGSSQVISIGTATSTVYAENSLTQYVISGLNHDMAVIYGYVVNQNPDLLPFLFNQADVMNGSSGVDMLSGYDGNDAIYGNGGADTLRGLKGRDSLVGGNGADTLIGGSGVDVLDGGLGIDELTGNGGADSFVLTGQGSNHDVINDFLTSIDGVTHGDRIVLDNEFFDRLSALDATYFSNNQFNKGPGMTQGQDADDRIIYNTDNGKLYYDADGSAAGASAWIATLVGSPDSLSFVDFRIAL